MEQLKTPQQPCTFCEEPRGKHHVCPEGSTGGHPGWRGRKTGCNDNSSGDPRGLMAASVPALSSALHVTDVLHIPATTPVSPVGKLKQRASKRPAQGPWWGWATIQGAWIQCPHSEPVGVSLGGDALPSRPNWARSLPGGGGMSSFLSGLLGGKTPPHTHLYPPGRLHPSSSLGGPGGPGRTDELRRMCPVAVASPSLPRPQTLNATILPAPLGHPHD